MSTNCVQGMAAAVRCKAPSSAPKRVSMRRSSRMVPRYTMHAFVGRDSRHQALSHEFLKI